MGDFNPPVTSAAKTSRANLLAEAKSRISAALLQESIRHRIATGNDDSIIVLVDDSRVTERASEIVASVIENVGKKARKARKKR